MPYRLRYAARLWEDIRFGYLLESPRRGDSNKNTNHLIYKRTVQKYPLLVLIKFLYDSEFDFTAKSLVTNIVVITRVLCNKLYLTPIASSNFCNPFTESFLLLFLEESEIAHLEPSPGVS